MRIQYSFACVLWLLPGAAGAQLSIPPAGGGAAPELTLAHDEMPLMQRTAIERMLEQNALQLMQQGKLAEPSGPAVSNVQFPLRARASYSSNSFYAISNYVDLNPAIGSLQDWNCGTRTYDLNDGSNYNHSGIDYVLWPFQWLLMDQQHIEIVAAAPGTIIGKRDGS